MKSVWVVRECWYHDGSEVVALCERLHTAICFAKHLINLYNKRTTRTPHKSEVYIGNTEETKTIYQSWRYKRVSITRWENLAGCVTVFEEKVY